MNTERQARGGPEQDTWIEGASQTWVTGDLIYNNGTSNLQICTVNGSSQLSSQIAGQAKVAAVGVAGTKVHFWGIRPDEEFFMNVYHSTIGSAITARTLLGTPRAIVKIGGIWMVDIENAVEGSNNSLARVYVTDIPNRVQGNVNTIGDTYGFVVATFLPLSLSLTGTLAAARLLQTAV